MKDESGARPEGILDAVAQELCDNSQELSNIAQALCDIAHALCDISAKGGRIDILPHVRADGDAVGSSLAVAMAIRQLGGNPRVFVEEPLDWTLSQLPDASNVQVGLPDGFTSESPSDAALMLDCNDVVRLASRAVLYDRAAKKIVMDHHISSQPSGELRMIDSSAAAVGQMVYHLIRQMEIIANRTLLAHEHAVCIMGAILTDTGGFRFSNTTRETFMVASSLMQYDVDISALSYEMLESMTLAKYRLIGLASEHARFFQDGKVAVLGVSRKLLEQTGADESDTNGLANMLRAIDTVRVAFVLKEGEDGIVRVNIRSKEGFDAAAFASAYGGGGHTRASGFNLEKTDLESAESMLAEKAGEWLSRA